MPERKRDFSRKYPALSGSAKRRSAFSDGSHSFIIIVFDPFSGIFVISPDTMIESTYIILQEDILAAVAFPNKLDIAPNKTNVKLRMADGLFFLIGCQFPVFELKF